MPSLAQQAVIKSLSGKHNGNRRFCPGMCSPLACLSAELLVSLSPCLSLSLALQSIRLDNIAERLVTPEPYDRWYNSRPGQVCVVCHTSLARLRQEAAAMIQSIQLAHTSSSSINSSTYTSTAVPGTATIVPGMSPQHRARVTSRQGGKLPPSAYASSASTLLASTSSPSSSVPLAVQAQAYLEQNVRAYINPKKYPQEDVDTYDVDDNDDDDDENHKYDDHCGDDKGEEHYMVIMMILMILLMIIALLMKISVLKTLTGKVTTIEITETAILIDHQTQHLMCALCHANKLVSYTVRNNVVSRGQFITPRLLMVINPGQQSSFKYRCVLYKKLALENSQD
ncbi:hypothetical protein PoB_003130400 [Plakobranchus ocellatus]|uniref:Kinesin-like protein KIF26A/B helical domain-containing protein n=1 Tax=Plakobranchus ocellatus TaxID=259542 RepID=A0AAV4AEX4_9GAST|nr:hypothetical protein PoB_003130400 [Plakobranchus ocellatus]